MALLFSSRRHKSICVWLYIILMFSPRLTLAGEMTLNEWIDESTGHKINRLTRNAGPNTGLYFHQQVFNAAGDRMVFLGSKGSGTYAFTVDLETFETRQITDVYPAKATVAPKRNELIYYDSDNNLCATNLDTLETRILCQVPGVYLSGVDLTINTDETLAVASYAKGAQEYFEKYPRSEWFHRIHQAHLENVLYSIHLDTGEISEFHTESNWLGHTQFSPTDPKLLSYCHEGPWEHVNRIWLIEADGANRRALREREMENEIWGHEFWDPNGEIIWFDLQRPIGHKAYLAGRNIHTGEETRYSLTRDQWSLHYNISPDGSRFCGDGGDETFFMHGKDGKWIYLFTPEEGELKVERLVNLQANDYSRCEPNSRFSPDGKWVIFTSNMSGENQVYAVEVAKSAEAGAEPKPAGAPREIYRRLGDHFRFLKQRLDQHPPRLAFNEYEGDDSTVWRATARTKMFELLNYNPPRFELNPQVLESVPQDGYMRHLVRYSIGDGRTTEAYLLIPENHEGAMPAVLALHDHSGFYYFGKEKIVDTGLDLPVLREHIDQHYGGRYIANELARQGFVVLAPDTFYFGSQRIDPSTLDRWETRVLDDLEPGTDAYIHAYNPFAEQREELTAKGLFMAGTTWPGVIFHGDRVALDYLLTRPEVDPERIGCMGLSIGGYRSAHLFGLDPRINAGLVVGWMTTYASLLYEHLLHTWMVFVPQQTNWLDLPDMVAINAPRPLMVVNCLQDILFTHSGMKAAEHKIRSVYNQMDATDNFQCIYDDVPHAFSLESQEKAFCWLANCLS